MFATEAACLFRAKLVSARQLGAHLLGAHLFSGLSTQTSSMIVLLPPSVFLPVSVTRLTAHLTRNCVCTQVGMFEDTNLAAIHARRVTIM